MAIPCKMVFKKNLDEYGRGIRYKARIVAKKFFRKEVFAFHETSVPVTSSFNVLVFVVANCVYED